MILATSPIPHILLISRRVVLPAPGRTSCEVCPVVGDSMVVDASGFEGERRWWRDQVLKVERF